MFLQLCDHPQSSRQAGSLDADTVQTGDKKKHKNGPFQGHILDCAECVKRICYTSKHNNYN